MPDLADRAAGQAGRAGSRTPDRLLGYAPVALTVAVAVTTDAVCVRSSLRPTEVTRLTSTEWRDLVAGIRNGEFDA
ncbi:hypothetical protein ACIPYS_32450 [Kitasatospora sp. NPDC089913]|uniref:hypothetical protein n=1 Tax=Kitasatospora sp. NPDC089913 TaxID=3364080 RepID=UPI0038267231